MNTTADTAAATARELLELAVLEVRDFIQRDGLMLFELLDFLGEDEGAEATLNLIALSGSLRPDPIAVADDVAEVLLSLQEISLFQLDEVVHSGDAPSDIYGALRWLGARVADLAARLKAP
ncbi:hypothetical protein [Palleronia sp.]|uniref:hypothetical protein n=1 Tax=Palleronia sp. TaxID=1940284 RepID=UPI0035C861DF